MAEKFIPAFYHPLSAEHNPKFEFSSGDKNPHLESRERYFLIMNALKESGIVNTQMAGIDATTWIYKIHALKYLKYLEETSKSAVEGQEIIPETFNYSKSNHVKNNIAKRAIYCFDTYTPIMNNTFVVACASASVAVTGAVNLSEKEPVIYALTRPPGHHVLKDRMGGMCYLNNASIATQALLDKGVKKVAILDIDYHHGNGTQDIFYDRNDVLVVNIHSDPEFEFPYFSGNKKEIGRGKGKGFNMNFPLPKGTTNEEYDNVLGKSLEIIDSYKPECVIVSAGFDTYYSDPFGGFKLTTDHYRQLGQQIKSLRIPTLILQEGGYTQFLGRNVVSFIKGFK